MIFSLLPDTFAIVRMAPNETAPLWTDGGPFVSMTRADSELSIVCRERMVPAGAHADRGWQCLKIEGPIPLKTVGIMAEAASVLAKAGVSVFPIATYATDYIFIKGDQMGTAVDALQKSGHSVRRT